MPTRSILLLFALILCSISLFAQRDMDDFCYLTIRLEAESEAMEMAKYYEEARQMVKVELIEYTFKGGQRRFGKRVQAYYNKKEDAWMARVHKGFYHLRTYHVGFNNIARDYELNMNEQEFEFKLRVDSIPYTYENGKTYDYIKGGARFSETIVVHFNSGDPAENMAFLEENFVVEKVQKIRYINSFFLTLSISNQETLPEILLRMAYEDETMPEGYYFGDVVTKTIEQLQENPAVRYANPTFIYTPNQVEQLSVEEQGSKAAMIYEFQKRSVTQPKLINADDYPKSQKLKRKLLQQMEE